MGCGASTAAAPAEKPVAEKAETVTAAKEATKAGMDLTAIFGQFDTSGDGFLQMDELKRAFRAIGLKKRAGADFELDQKTFASFDTNGDGKVSLAEFNANLHPKTRKKIEEKLSSGWTFDAAKWAEPDDGGAAPEAAAEPPAAPPAEPPAAPEEPAAAPEEPAAAPEEPAAAAEEPAAAPAAEPPAE